MAEQCSLICTEPAEVWIIPRTLPAVPDADPIPACVRHGDIARTAGLDVIPRHLSDTVTRD